MNFNRNRAKLNSQIFGEKCKLYIKSVGNILVSIVRWSRSTVLKEPFFNIELSVLTIALILMFLWAVFNNQDQYTLWGESLQKTLSANDPVCVQRLSDSNTGCQVSTINDQLIDPPLYMSHGYPVLEGHDYSAWFSWLKSRTVQMPKNSTLRKGSNIYPGIECRHFYNS